MKIINFAGAPSAGKSTSAAATFAAMKLAGYNCELVTEYAKDVVWRESYRTLEDQLYILAKQNNKLHRLSGKVQYVVTDSPLFLALVYSREDYYPSFNKLALEIFNSYDNFNVFLNRVKPFNPVGRMQKTGEESDLVAVKVKTVLTQNNIPFIEMDGDEKVAGNILAHLKKQ